MVLSYLKNRWFMLSMLCVCWALISTFLAGYYWLQYSDVLGRIGGVPIYVTVGVDYGNQTRTWFNDTKALTGMTLFRITKDSVDTTYDTASGFGVYVKSIGGLASNSSHGWVWWKWDTFVLNWTRIDISADAYAAADEEIFLWYYEAGWPPPPPP